MPTRTDTLRAPPAFLAGALLSFIPAVGPFVAVLLLFARRWRFERRDAIWAVAALLFAAPSVVRGGPWDVLSSLGLVFGPWIVFRSFGELHRLDRRFAWHRPFVWGLLVGYASIVASGLVVSLSSFRPQEALTVLGSLVWTGSPALYGHVVLTVGSLIALVTLRRPAVAWSAMGLAAFAIFMSGSLDAAMAWIVVAGAFLALQPRRSTFLRLASVLVMLGVATAVLIASPWIGWGKIGFVLPSDAVQPTRNLLTGTEIPRGDWWDDHWVQVSAERTTIDGDAMRAYTVTKRGSEQWLRLQQTVPLAANERYTLSAWIDTADARRAGVVPGLQGYGSEAPEARPLVLIGRYREEGWAASLDGPGRMVDSGSRPTSDGWTRVWVTFDVGDVAAPIAWHAGFTPDARDSAGGTARVAGLMLEASSEVGPYVAGSASRGLDLGYARTPLWAAAWEAIASQPVTGWGPGAFADVYQSTRPGIERQELVPAHPHNLVLAVVFERGWLGLAGLAVLLAALVASAVRRRDVGFLAVVAAVLLANAFDATLLTGGVLYPLAAAAGWRSARRSQHEASGTDGARHLLARIGLAAADALVGVTALLAAHGVTSGWSASTDIGQPLLYVALVWPAMAWREGLYPGYGLTPPQELKRQVKAWAFASGLVALGSVLLPEILSVALPVAIVWFSLVLVAAPPARALTKRGLHALGSWGSRVIVLGAGTTGQRIVRALQRSPLDGLHPVAFFDDDPETSGRRLLGLRVRGTLEDAPAFAARHGIQRAIVAIPSLAWSNLDHLISGHGRVLRRVQFIPRLGSLPSEDVVATELDGMLALEVRNGLYAPVNRMAKRTGDLVLAALAGLLVAPLVLVLWLLVRLDSSGGGFHRSERVGQDGRPIDCLKFRTMHVDAEERLEALLASDDALRDEYVRWHKLQRDPRTTRLGAFLRRTSLDELPQLWNVVKGEMSLVGPRPYLRREVPDMGRHAAIILQAKPGITGHWQVSARNTVSFEERLEMEAHYVRNWSIWWDVILLFSTPLAVLSGKGEAK